MNAPRKPDSQHADDETAAQSPRLINMNELDIDDESSEVKAADAVIERSERAAMMRRARQKGGTGGAVMMGAMMALQGLIETPRKEPIAVVVDAASEPINPDADGITLQLDDTSLFAPPLPPLKPPVMRKRKWGSNRR